MRWLRFPRMLGILVCLYLLGMAVIFGLFSQQSVRFVRDAARTQGTVVALVARAPAGSTREPTSGARTVPLAPRVTYSVDGNTYAYTGAHGRFHQQLQVGNHVQVLYDPTDPSRARLRGEGSVLVPGIAVTFALAAALVAFILFRTRRLGAPSGPGARRLNAVPVAAGRRNLG